MMYNDILHKFEILLWKFIYCSIGFVIFTLSCILSHMIEKASHEKFNFEKVKMG